MTNPNTKVFWEDKIVNEGELLSKSPIFQHKNRIISRYLFGFRGRILNVGVGYGFLELTLRKEAPKADLFGIDISENAIRNAKHLVGGNFFVASAAKIPFFMVGKEFGRFLGRIYF